MAEVEVEVKEAPAETENEAPKEPEPEPVEAPVEPPPEEPSQRTVVLTGHGGYSKLKVEKRPIPKATDGHVVVKVHTSGLNFADLMQRQGMYPHAPKLPYIPGYECSGVVEEVGEHVTGLEVGSRVCCIVLQGAWAEYIAVPFTSCFVMPESMTFEEGAAFPVVYLTAYIMLFYCGNLRKKNSVLIHMAAGGVGTAVTQICKTVEGVTVFGTASATKHEAISKNGVDHPIDYRSEDFVEAIKKITSGIDLVLDPLGGSDTKKCYDLLNPLGTLVIFGWANNIAESKGMFAGLKSWYSGITFNPTKLMTENRTVCGFDILKLVLSGHQDVFKDAMEDLMKMYQDGALKPCIDSVFALEEVAKAQQKMHDRLNIGKILLSPLKEPDPEAEPVKKRKKSGSIKKSKNVKDDKSGDEKETEETGKEVDSKEAEKPAEAGEGESSTPAEEAKEEAAVLAAAAPVEAKDETKEEAKEEPKEETKEEVKEEPKEEAKEEPKEEPKEAAKEEAKEEPKEEPKEVAKEEAKEEPKEETKEVAKEEAKEETKEEVKEEAKEETKEEVKEEPKEEAKEDAKPEESKETMADEPAKKDETQQADSKEEEEEQNTEM